MCTMLLNFTLLCILIFLLAFVGNVRTKDDNDLFLSSQNKSCEAIVATTTTANDVVAFDDEQNTNNLTISSLVKSNGTDDLNEKEELVKVRQSKEEEKGKLTLEQTPRVLMGELKERITSRKTSLLKNALDLAAKQGLDAMSILYEKIEPDILRKGQFLDPNHPASLLSKFSAPLDGTENNAKAAFATLIATKQFKKAYQSKIDDFGRTAPSAKISFRRTPLEGLCPPRDLPRCMPAAQRYRTHDGSCNNKGGRARWGSAQMPFNRFLPPEYNDGIDSVRASLEGGPLPSARFVSLLVHGAKDGDAPVTLMLAQWGQLIDHDLTSTAQPRSINGSVPRCCGPDDLHPSCLPIKVPQDDPWLAPMKLRCLEFLRSAPAQRRDCALSWREQTNQVTSFLDASSVYSSNARTSDNARVFRNGLLLFGRGNPQDDLCLKGAIGIGSQCIRSGDGRSGEQPGLLAMHHVWVGEHNRIAVELSDLNPHWSDEKVYQETRRIIGAMFQHITYREFLPLVLGREVSRLFGLELLTTGYYKGYDSSINPTVANSFSAAAFRFGHSLISPFLMRCDRNHNFIDNNVTLHEEFSHGDLGSPGSLHRLLRGLCNQRALERDEFITPELTNHLFQTGNFPFGLDLAAINIQRGRDHGIPPYTAWREPCGLSPIRTWEDLQKIVGPGTAERIRHAYRSVHDIDLWTGGSSERSVRGGLVGPTFACIIAQQFSNLRRGDRFWYENSGFESSFTPAQLHSIRQTSLAQVICRAIGGTLQLHVFIPHEAPGNQRSACGLRALAHIDLSPWREHDPFLNTKASGRPGLITSSTDIPSSVTVTNQQDNFNKTAINRVDFISNGITGMQKPVARHNITKVDNKLDILSAVTTLPKINHIAHIHDKLDNKRRILAAMSPIESTEKQVMLTTRRTVVINNIPLILRRSVDGESSTPEQNGTQLRTEDIDFQFTNEKNEAKDQGRGAFYVEIDRNSTSEQKIEQREYGNDNYSYKPKQQKVVIEAPNTDEYEIEINIRPTNDKNKKPYYYSDRQQHTTTSSNYVHGAPTRPPYLQNQYGPIATKPPKVIYLNEQEDYYGPTLLPSTTTQQSGLLQTFFMIGTNSILDHFRRPSQQVDGGFVNGGGGSFSSSSSSAAAVAAASVSATVSSSGSLASASASTSAVSSSSSSSDVSGIGCYRCTGFDGLNVDGNTFNFPLADVSASQPSSTSRPLYGFSSGRPSYANSKISVSSTISKNPFSSNSYPRYPMPTSTVDSFPIYNRDPSTYYSTYSPSTTRRPFYRPSSTSSYFLRNKEIPDFRLAIDDSAKTKTVRNNTDIKKGLKDDYYYDDNDDDDEERMTEEGFELVIQHSNESSFDEDGYLRPEHISLTNFSKNATNDIIESETKAFNDDIVLPVLNKFKAYNGNQTETEMKIDLKTLELNGTEPRRRIHSDDILAEDYDEIATPIILASEPLKLDRPSAHNNDTAKVAYAPLNILTRPERPDNWIFYDIVGERPPLPQLPEISKEEVNSTAEFPKPIQLRVAHISKWERTKRVIEV